jgi:hypothetical protein
MPKYQSGELVCVDDDLGVVEGYSQSQGRYTIRDLSDNGLRFVRHETVHGIDDDIDNMMKQIFQKNKLRVDFISKKLIDALLENNFLKEVTISLPRKLRIWANKDTDQIANALTKAIVKKLKTDDFGVCLNVVIVDIVTIKIIIDRFI